MKIHLLLEGQLEEAVANRLLSHCGHTVGNVYGKQGVHFIKNKTHSFHSIAKSGTPVLVLTDFMDSKCQCIPEAINTYLLKYITNPSPLFLLRFAVMEIESWLISDRFGFAQYFKISIKRIPTEPEKEIDPKATVVTLAKNSRNITIKNSIVPDSKHRGKVAPGYNSILTDFVLNYWNIENASYTSSSLRRCLEKLKSLNL